MHLCMIIFINVLYILGSDSIPTVWPLATGKISLSMVTWLKAVTLHCILFGKGGIFIYTREVFGILP